MARKKATDKGNKSKAILEYCKNNPEAGPKAVAEALQGQGFEVTPAFVSTVKSNAKRKAGISGGKRGRKGRPASGGTVSLDRLRQAKKLAEQMGGVEEAKSALDALASLLS